MRLIASLLLAAQACALKKVLVTGAGGRTGKLVFEQLKADANYKPVGLVRSGKAQKALRAVGASDDEVCVADVADESALAAAMAGCDAVVLCTSAVPAIKKLSLVKTLAAKVLPFVKTSRPAFKFSPKSTPEEVDWIGAKKQIDAAKSAGIEQFVFVSSMGGTNPDNFLNSFGR
jgi:saccharopine dehydrogenase-like NADP-dependent oxidoreductase